jgi:alpha-D-ribose 1-methylphosphonate 5-triphosphate synthase subunit PhnH
MTGSYHIFVPQFRDQVLHAQSVFRKWLIYLERAGLAAFLFRTTLADCEFFPPRNWR